jgi:hypothetical protein
MNYKKELDKVAESLTKIITAAREEYPDAFLYAEAEGTIILMSGDVPSEAPRGDKHKYKIESSKFIPHWDCGGW